MAKLGLMPGEKKAHQWSRWPKRFRGGKKKSQI